MFAAILKIIYREDNPKHKNNRFLFRFINEKTPDEIYELINQHSDLRSVAHYLSPETKKMRAGIITTLFAMFNQVFVKDFKRSDKPDFSIREYMENPDGRALFLLFDITKEKTIAPIYRLLLDTAAKYAIQPKTKHYKKFFIVDEMQFLPHLQKYQALVNTGREYNALIITGIQSIAQLNDAYGKNIADAIASGNKYMILLRTGDQQTTQFARNQIGKKEKLQKSHHGVPTGDGDFDIEETEHTTIICPVSEHEIKNYLPGQCVIVAPHSWHRVILQPYDKSKEYIDNVDARIAKTKAVDLSGDQTA